MYDDRLWLLHFRWIFLACLTITESQSNTWSSRLHKYEMRSSYSCTSKHVTLATLTCFEVRIIHIELAVKKVRPTWLLDACVGRLAHALHRCVAQSVVLELLDQLQFVEWRSGKVVHDDLRLSEPVSQLDVWFKE